jgi:hypothetical protein
LKEIESFGEPKKEESGRLEFNYYKTVSQAIMQKAKVVFADEKKEFLNKRRQLLKDKKMEEYNAVVIEMVKKE